MLPASRNIRLAGETMLPANLARAPCVYLGFIILIHAVIHSIYGLPLDLHGYREKTVRAPVYASLEHQQPSRLRDTIYPNIRSDPYDYGENWRGKHVHVMQKLSIEGPSAKKQLNPLINPKRACAAWVTVVVLCVCVSVRTRYSGSIYARLKV